MSLWSLKIVPGVRRAPWIGARLEPVGHAKHRMWNYELCSVLGLDELYTLVAKDCLGSYFQSAGVGHGDCWMLCLIKYGISVLLGYRTLKCHRTGLQISWAGTSVLTSSGFSPQCFQLRFVFEISFSRIWKYLRNFIFSSFFFQFLKISTKFPVANGASTLILAHS